MGRVVGSGTKIKGKKITGIRSFLVISRDQSLD